MQLIATLGDAPITVIAVVAILVGVMFAARGPRDKRRPADGEVPAGPTLVSSVPVVTPEAEEGAPGFVGPTGGIVGHGTIRLGQTGLLGAAQAEPALPGQPEAAPAAEPAPVPSSEPASQGPPPPSNTFRQGTIKLGGRPAGKPPPTD